MKLEDVGFVMNDKGIMELVDYELLIEKFIEKNKLIMLKNNKGKYSYYMYDEYYWKLTDEVEIIREMVNFLSNIEPKTWKYKYSNPVIHFLQLALKIEDKMDKYKYIMEFKDFAVNLRNGYVEEKDVERYNTYYKKYTVEELDNSTCPVFESFLKDIDVHFLKLPQEEQMARRIDERASRFCREQNERAARSLFDEPASQSSYGRSSSNISGGQKTFLVGERPKVEIIRPSIPRNLTKVGPETVSKPSAARNLSVNVQAGQVIEHERFGIGDVIKVEGIGENSKATVRFRNAGEKQLLLKFARFKVVE